MINLDYEQLNRIRARRGRRTAAAGWSNARMKRDEKQGSNDGNGGDKVSGGRTCHHTAPSRGVLCLLTVCVFEGVWVLSGCE